MQIPVVLIRYATVTNGKCRGCNNYFRIFVFTGRTILFLSMDRSEKCSLNIITCFLAYFFGFTAIILSTMLKTTAEGIIYILATSA